MLYCPGEQRFLFTFLGLGVNMEKLDLHSLKTGLESQFLSKPYTVWIELNILEILTWFLDNFEIPLDAVFSFPHG